MNMQKKGGLSGKKATQLQRASGIACCIEQNLSVH